MGKQVQYVSTVEELLRTPYQGSVNAIGWMRTLRGDFSEIVRKIEPNGNITVIQEKELLELQLSEEGQRAREIILNDLEVLKAHGASPNLNLIHHYERDLRYPFFPTDVYSFHVDQSPVPTDTFLCTYYGASSEIIPNEQAEQKVLIPELRGELRKLYTGAEDGFESFLNEHFFDLHYQPKPNAQLFSLGPGTIWKLAIDHPRLEVLPCIHRAPMENPGEPRLLLIC